MTERGTMQTVRTLRRRGFTLVEMLIVITMIGIMTGIALWRVDIARYQVNGDIQSIGTTLIASQREAIAKQHNVIVVFDTAGNRVRVIWDANNNGQYDDGEHTRMVFLGDRVRFGLGTAPQMPIGPEAVNFTDTETSSGLPVRDLLSQRQRERGGRRVHHVAALDRRSEIRDVTIAPCASSEPPGAPSGGTMTVRPGRGASDAQSNAATRIFTGRDHGRVDHSHDHHSRSREHHDLVSARDDDRHGACARAVVRGHADRGGARLSELRRTHAHVQQHANAGSGLHAADAGRARQDCDVDVQQSGGLPEE